MCHFYNAQLSETTGAAKGVFTHSQSSCHIAKVVLEFTAAKSPQRLTRHLATPPAVSSIGGLRTPAPVCAAPPSWGRHPQTFTTAEVATVIQRSARVLASTRARQPFRQQPGS